MKKAGVVILLVLAVHAVRATDTLTIAAVGDIMMGTAYPGREYLPPNNDCLPLMANVKPYLQKADVTFCNLEGPLTDSLKNVKTCKDPDVCYAFAMPTAYASCLADAGFDLVSVANNHTGDFGDAGRGSTAEALKKQGIAYAGLISCPTAIIERNGAKIGFCAFAPNSGTCRLNDYSAAERIVRGLDSICDVVIVSFHAGAEGAGMHHVTRQTEMFVGENRGNVYEFTRRMIDAGADVLLGHGPHVTRAVDLYKGRFIAYSMGNFCTYSRINLNGMNGLAPLINLEVNKKTGEFLGGKIIPTYQDKAALGVQIDEQPRVIKEIQQLTEADFPETMISIANDGTLSVK
ncbi:MAG: CapA family protein [Prevotellaceae bacterium]|jgi:poly-gamma-glutamate capsule biosynthesis protein CapA/YwtB (metallophosphatase superfamily)|nr:CapA family protein [Prevotellaceae bacterium]